MYISFFSNELILYDFFLYFNDSVTCTHQTTSSKLKVASSYCLYRQCLPNRAAWGKKSNTLNWTMMSQTISPTSLRSPTGTDLVTHHLQHLQQKHSKKLYSVSRNWEHTCQLHEQIQTDLLCHSRVGKYGFCLWRCSSQHSALLLG